MATNTIPAATSASGSKRPLAQKVSVEAVINLEGDFCDLLMVASILNELVEVDTGRVFEKTTNGESYAQLFISREEAERLTWMAGECLHRVRKLHTAYFAAMSPSATRGCSHE